MVVGEAVGGGAVLMAMRLVMGQAVKRVPSKVLLFGRVVVMRMLGGSGVVLAGWTLFTSQGGGFIARFDLAVDGLTLTAWATLQPCKVPQGARDERLGREGGGVRLTAPQSLRSTQFPTTPCLTGRC